MTDSVSHTPGPWTLDYSRGPAAIRAEGSKFLAVLEFGSRSSISVDDANARLIAAAPDLLAALKVLAEAFAYRRNITVQQMADAGAAIAKAEGK